jgi:predicted PurR-regulated permease PerM
MTRKKPIGSVIAIVIVVLIFIGLYGYFGYALYQQNKTLTNLEQTTISNTGQVTQIGNYLNSVISSQQKAATK